MSYLETLAKNARTAARSLALLGTEEKNAVLHKMADALLDDCDKICDANALDMENAGKNGMSLSTQDRLRLDAKRIDAMAEGVRDVAALPDPVGDIEAGFTRPNGLRIVKTRVPLGVVAMIYEARPNVTSDSAALCCKSGNAVILRGGKEAINSNMAVATSLRRALNKCGLDENAVQLVEDTSRETATALMGLTGYIDVLIPRGGAGLIQSVVKTARVPVIETGSGVCHVYVDGAADLEMAENIIINAKLQRPSVCNAMETLLIDSAIAPQFAPHIVDALTKKGCEVRGCGVTVSLCRDIISGKQLSLRLATDADWATEYGLPIINCRVVDGINGALKHIAQYSTKHSEAIVTRDYQNAMRFHREVDAAAVYVNASTRFTDGGVFGFGAEIGISTQKLHARGPVGLRELTTTKYMVFGEGQVRV